MISEITDNGSRRSVSTFVKCAFAVVIIAAGIVWSIMFPKTRAVLRPDFITSVAIGLGLIATGILIFFINRSRLVRVVLSTLLLWSVLCNVVLCTYVLALRQLALELAG